MGRLVRAVAVPLLCLALLAGRYGRNPTPPDLQEAWIYNMFVGLVDFVSDLVNCALLLFETKDCT